MNENQKPWFMCWLVWTGIAIIYMTYLGIPPMIKKIILELKFTHEQIGSFMSAPALLLSIGSLLAGYLADRFGSKLIAGVGVLFAGICAYLFTLTAEFPLMLTFRLLLGLGIAFLVTSANVFVISWLPPERRTIGLSGVSASITLGNSIAFLLTPILIENYHWRSVLQWYAILGIVSAIAFCFLAQNPPVKFNRGEAHGKHEDKDSITYSSLAIIPIAIAKFFVFFTLLGMSSWVLPWLTEACKFSPTQVGVAGMVYMLVAIPASLFGGWQADKTGKDVQVILIGFIITLITLPLTWIKNLSFFLILISLILIHLGVCMTFGPFLALTAKVVAPEHRGKAFGFVITIGLLGGAVSPYLGGYILTATGRYELVFLTFVVAVFLATLVMYLSFCTSWFQKERQFV